MGMDKRYWMSRGRQRLSMQRRRSRFWRSVLRFPIFFFFSSRGWHTRWNCDWSSDVCSSDLVWILELTGTPDARELTYVTQTLPVEGGPLGPHDMYVTQDAVDGHWYLYSSDGFHGWAAFKIGRASCRERE